HRSKDYHPRCFFRRNKKGRGTSLRRRTTTSILKRDCSSQSRPPGALVREISARAVEAHEPFLLKGPTLASLRRSTGAIGGFLPDAVALAPWFFERNRTGRASRLCLFVRLAAESHSVQSGLNSNAAADGAGLLRAAESADLAR